MIHPDTPDLEFAELITEDVSESRHRYRMHRPWAHQSAIVAAAVLVCVAALMVIRRQPEQSVDPTSVGVTWNASLVESFTLSRVFKETPKVELHTHLDGALQPKTLCKLATEHSDVKLLNTTYLSSDFPEGCRTARKSTVGALHPPVIAAQSCPLALQPYVTAFHTSSLSDFLQPFGCIAEYLRLPGGIEAMGRSFVPQQAQENIVYTEAQFAPQLLLASCNPFTDCDPGSVSVMEELKDIVKKTIKGIVASQAKFVTVKLLLDCFRNLNVSFCEQVVDLAIGMKQSSEQGVSADGARFAFSDYIVGLNLAGDEIHFPNSANPGGGESFAELFARKQDSLQRAGLGVALHSGEPSFPESAQDCLVATDRMGALRVGHGYHCTLEHLKQIRDRNLHIEVCPESSMATGAVSSWADHPIATMAQLGVSISLNTDDRAVIGTTMSDQYELVRSRLGFSLVQLARASLDGMHSSFANLSTKIRVCDQIRDWWMHKVEAEGRDWVLNGLAPQLEVTELIGDLQSIDCSMYSPRRRNHV